MASRAVDCAAPLKLPLDQHLPGNDVPSRIPRMSKRMEQVGPVRARRVG